MAGDLWSTPGEVRGPRRIKECFCRRNGALGSITGPGDVIIIGGSYVAGSVSARLLLDKFNEQVIKYIPQADPYIP